MSAFAPIPRVILVHGFNVSDGGAGSVLTLTPYFERVGLQVKRFRYGWLFLLGVKFLNDRLARLLADFADRGDIVVAHSNGAAIAHLAATKYGAEFSHLILINPALDRDAEFPESLRNVHVWHSPSDAPVSWARWIPGALWGDMGAVGYQGPYNPRVVSFNKENGYPVSSRAHSDVFREPALSFFAPEIVHQLIKRLP
jgi:pimeloyl-ACP methyl ester carboxylesterase